MALGAATNWEVRGGTGNDANGGAFAGMGHLAAPSAPSLATTTGGTLTVATWYLVVSYCFYNGTTSFSGPKSAEASIAVPNTTNDAIVVTSPAASVGATHYRVWGSTTSGGPYWPLGSTTGTVIGTNVTITTVVTSGVQCPGVDYSQQAAPQVVIDAATITTSSDSGSTTLTFTAGYTPTAADVGNQVRITGGTGYSAGYRQIVGFTATTWVADAAWQSSGSTQTGLTANMGGALATIGQTLASVVAGNYVWIKAATYAETLTTAVAGGNRNPICWVGYSATRGDYPRGDDRPLIDGGGARANCIVSAQGNNAFICLRTTGATAANVSTSTTTTFIACKASAAGAEGFLHAGSGNALYVWCEAATSGTIGFSVSTTATFVFCYAHDSGSYGFYPDCKAYIACIADSNGNAGFVFRSGVAFGCTSYNSTGSGFASAGSNGGLFMAVMCIALGNSAYGYAEATTSTWWLLACVAYNNTSGDQQNVIAIASLMLENADPALVAPASGDFTPGSSMAADGIGITEGLAVDSTIYKGAVQRTIAARTINGGLVQ